MLHSFSGVFLGRCDDVIGKVMQHLNVEISSYTRENDPLFRLATLLNECERPTTLRKELEIPRGVLLRRSRNTKRNHRKLPSDDDDDDKIIAAESSVLTPKNMKKKTETNVESASLALCSTSVLDTSQHFRDHNYAHIPSGDSQTSSQNLCESKLIVVVDKEMLDLKDTVTTNCSTNNNVKVKTEEDISEEIDDSEKLQNPSPGWFGKGYRKQGKRKKRR